MNPKQKLRNQCDILFYQICLANNPICEICEKTAHQAHHFYPKSCYSHLRYELLNGISLCLSCHFILTHVNRRLEDKIRAKKGEKWFKKLQKMAYKKSKSSFQTLTYYEKIKKRLEKLLN